MQEGMLIRSMVCILQQLLVRSDRRRLLESIAQVTEECIPVDLLKALMPLLDLVEALLLTACTIADGVPREFADLSRMVAALCNADTCALYSAATDGQAPVCCGEYGGRTIAAEPPESVAWTLRDAVAWHGGDSICVPLRSGDTCIGVLYCSRQRGATFTDEDAELVLLAAPLCMPMVRRARCDAPPQAPPVTTLAVPNGARPSSGELDCPKSPRVLHPHVERGENPGPVDHASAMIFRAYAFDNNSFERMLAKVNNEVMSMLDCEWAAVHLTDDSGKQSEPIVCTRAKSQQQGLHLQSIPAANKRASVIYPRASSAIFLEQKKNQMAVSGCAPLEVPLNNKDGAALGVLKAGNPCSGQSFREADKSLLTTLAGEVSFLVDNSLTLQKLRQESNFLHAIFDSMANGVIIADVDGNATKANAAAERILAPWMAAKGKKGKRLGSFTSQAFLGQPVANILGSSPEVQQAIDNVLRLNTTQYLADHQVHITPNSSGSARERANTLPSNDDTSNILHMNITVAPLMQLARTLRAYDKRTSQMFAAGKTLEDLQREIQMGAAALEFGSEVTRIVKLVVFRVVTPSGKLLVEYSRARESSEEEMVEPRMPATVRNSSETDQVAAWRGVMDLPAEVKNLVKDCVETSETSVEYRESNHYLGLATEYSKVFFEVRLTQEPASSGAAYFESLRNGKLRKYCWMRMEEAVPKGVKVSGEMGKAKTNKKQQQQHREEKPHMFGVILMLEDITAEMRTLRIMTRYLGNGLANEVLALGEEAHLGGKLVNAIVLFSDIRSFTTLTEELGPEETVGMLNEYFEAMVQCITSHGGIIDKFIGDAIMAFWGTPFKGHDDADRALDAAIDMLVELESLNTTRASRGQFPLRIGIGISSGPMVAGNIGSLQRMEYTVIGDSVNLGSRLEACTKEYGVDILVSDSLRLELRKPHRLREIDWLVVKGKKGHSSVWEPVPEEASEVGLQLFQDGLRAYRDGHFDVGRKAFQAALQEMPEDGPAKVYMKRCAALQLDRPDTWDGVWRMTTK